MVDHETAEAQLRAELLAEKWDLPEPCFAPWNLLDDRHGDLRRAAQGIRPLADTARDKRADDA